MDKYTLHGNIGDGTYGTVIKATLKKTGEAVAIKKMKQKYTSWEQCIRLPEVVVLRKLHSCPNIVKLKEVIRENNILYFVFEMMDGDLLGTVKQFKGVGVPHARIRSITAQILQGLQQLHKSGYFHRDMKPENVLVRKDGGAEILKLADLGLVKEIRGRPPFTDYVSTRWYRAPEILLQDKAYNSPVDIFALGCMIVELFTTRPLFPGANELDQLFRIQTVLGTPTQESWPEGLVLAKKLRYQFRQVAPTPLGQLYPQIPPQALDLIQRMLAFNPRNRPTATEALQHPFLATHEVTPHSLPAPSQVAPLRAVGKATAPSTQQTTAQVDWRDVTGNSTTMGGGSGSGGGAGAKKPSVAYVSSGKPASSLPALGPGKPSTAGNAALPPVEIAKYTAPKHVPRPPPVANPTMPVVQILPTLPSPSYNAPSANSGGTGANGGGYAAPAGGGARGSTVAAGNGGGTLGSGRAALNPLSSGMTNAGPGVSPTVANAATGATLAQKMAGLSLRDSFEDLFSKSTNPQRNNSIFNASGTNKAGAGPTPTHLAPVSGRPSMAGVPAPSSKLNGTGTLGSQGQGSPGLPTGGATASPFDSPLAKLLGASRYRSGSVASDGGGIGSARQTPSGGANSLARAVHGGGGEGSAERRRTFQSPSYSKRPAPLSSTILQQQVQRH